MTTVNTTYSVDYLLGRTDDPSSNSIATGNNRGNDDGVSREKLDRFQTLKFEDKVEVMSLIAERRATMGTLAES